MSDENRNPADAPAPDTPTEAPASEPGVEGATAEASYTEEVRTTLTPEERRAKRWAETKGDLKWAAVALFVLYAIFAVVWQYTGWQAPVAGTEDIDAVTTVIFSPDGLVGPFEILSVLLLAALIAGVAISLRDPYGGEETAAWRSRDVEPHGYDATQEREA